MLGHIPRTGTNPSRPLGIFLERKAIQGIRLPMAPPPRIDDERGPSKGGRNRYIRRAKCSSLHTLNCRTSQCADSRAAYCSTRCTTGCPLSAGEAGEGAGGDSAQEGGGGGAE
eukprot:549906-Prorocentrum_minimum.AAC.1